MGQPFTTPIELRFSDLDLYGHVNSVVYFSFIETARVRFFRSFFHELAEKHIFTLVAHAECDYRIQILPGNKVVISVVVSRIGTTSFDLDYRIYDGAEKTYATARTTIVCYDNEKKTAVPVPECIRGMVLESRHD